MRLLLGGFGGKCSRVRLFSEQEEKTEKYHCSGSVQANTLTYTLSDFPRRNLHIFHGQWGKSYSVRSDLNSDEARISLQRDSLFQTHTLATSPGLCA
jgi:hypothetical protein